MIQQDFDFETCFIIPPEYEDIDTINNNPSKGHCAELRDNKSGIKLEIWGHKKSYSDVKAFYEGLKAHTEVGKLNPVSKALVQFGYWLQVNYNRLKEWYNGFNSA